MSGYAYGEKEPTGPCPYCSAECHADFVDIGVGYDQCGPYHCEACGASEIGPYDEPRELGPDEKRTGWYAPGSDPGSSANVIGGKVVPAHQMINAYYGKFAGNPDYEKPNLVEDWFKEIRKKT